MTTALYRRYRPDSFSHVIGQEHVTDPLRAALRANKVTHAYLFSGPRGCGKTTSARILARCLNCAQGPTDTPCGECDSCKELATGGPGSLDVVEIDAASHGGVDDARELRERATFAPVRDRYKVFIIDEAHMVTPQGFNALLKLVEEPPEHVKFVFATTEPDRVLGTIRSRTHHYPFRLVPPDALEPYLAQLSAEEGIEIAPGVLGLVIRAGGGSVRDTLSVLDQLMAGTIDGTLGYHQAVSLLGYTDAALLDETVDALAGGDGAAVYRVVERMVESGHDPRRFVEDLLQRLRDLLIISVAGDGAADVLSGTPADQLDRMITQARNWGPRHLSRAADLTDQALRSMVGATSPRLQLELLIGRILVPVTSGHSSNDPALPGAVGMAGGGAPHEVDARTSSAQESSDGRRFGAAQAREELRRKRQAEGGAPPSEHPHSSAQGSLPGQPQEKTTPPADTSSETVASGWTDVAATVPGSGTVGQSGAQPVVEQTREPQPAGPLADSESPREASAAQAESPTQRQSFSHDQASQQHPMPQSPAPSASRDSDMLRQRWPEVIERLSSISRVAWSLLRGNGQLGSVDETTAVVLLPTEGMVDNFMRGNRGVDVERAIHEATGLTLTVIAQVGQASGGAQVTTPTAQAAHPAQGANAHERQEVSAPADPFRVEAAYGEVSTPLPSDNGPTTPKAAGLGGEWPETGMSHTQAPEPTSPESVRFVPEPSAPELSEPVPSEPVVSDSTARESEMPEIKAPEMGASGDLDWPTPVMPAGAQVEEPSISGDAHSSPGANYTWPADPHGWPEAAVPPTVPLEERASVLDPAAQTPDPFAPPAPQALAAWSAVAQPSPDTDTPNVQSGHASETASTPVSTHLGASSVFGDDVYGDRATGRTSANSGHASSAGFTRPRLTPVEGGAAADSIGSPSMGSPAPSERPSFGAQGPRANTTPAAMSAPKVSAAEDDSASIDDVDVENSQSHGLPAVFEVLGGKVIEEITTEGGW
ncbi:DNA polymerase III subunit gamma and tau [Schaalia canis]|uniref:DNA-directed DNA polymerase n=1 Tax=Schaalia canis TaxID=100469 RepID=A0A3P1SEY1_9ACTO|nr:DNA polymerase III subunit gamma and tau [Schaalia canis]RRC95851.1 DNA polymerase III subunit gamma and tau [Schaalia canis]